MRDRPSPSGGGPDRTLSRGVVAAGHPATAEAGAWALRQGGNAVDAAVAAVVASLVAESPLTGLGAGGHMLVHRPEGETVLLDFFVAAPGLGGTERRSELEPVEVDFGDQVQLFNIGAASCGVPGVPSGLAQAARAHGTMPLRDLVGPGVDLARQGLVLNPQQGYLLKILAPIMAREPAGAAVYAPAGPVLGVGDSISFPDLAATLERFGEEGPEPFYRGDLAGAISDAVVGAGGTLSREDLAAYETITRAPVRAAYAGREILSNPPPSSGGVLIAYALELLDRHGRTDTQTMVSVMEQAQSARTRDFLSGLYEPGFEVGFLADRLGSTTHITAVDGAGGCASVTCSNGTGSGLVVGGTGIHVNNMLGETDLNPFGFHSTNAGRRLPSMMSPTIALREGRFELGLGSGGSNRIRSAITQTIARNLGEGLDIEAAVEAPRVHFEDGVVQAEPGIEPAELEGLTEAGYDIFSWQEPNLFFGGVHAVSARGDGTFVGAGDPRRGGAVAMA